jgi:uncharacterized protein YoxC
MPGLIQACIVVATVAFVALAVVAIRALLRVQRAATELSTGAKASMAHVERIARDTEEILDSVRDVVKPAQKVARRWQSVGERAADLGDFVLDEIQEPVLTAAAVARGLKVGATRLVGLIGRRARRGHPGGPYSDTHRNGELNDE